MTQTAFDFDDLPGGPVHNFGMSSGQLADAVGSFISLAQARIKGDGKNQYETSGAEGAQEQAFERMSLNRLAKEFDDEILDSVVYMILFRINFMRRLKMVSDALNEIESDLG